MAARNSSNESPAVEDGVRWNNLLNHTEEQFQQIRRQLQQTNIQVQEQSQQMKQMQEKVEKQNKRIEKLENLLSNNDPSILQSVEEDDEVDPLNYLVEDPRAAALGLYDSDSLVIVEPANQPNRERIEVVEDVSNEMSTMGISNSINYDREEVDENVAEVSRNERNPAELVSNQQSWEANFNTTNQQQQQKQNQQQQEQSQQQQEQSQQQQEQSQQQQQQQCQRQQQQRTQEELPEIPEIRKLDRYMMKQKFDFCNHNSKERKQFSRSMESEIPDLQKLKIGGHIDEVGEKVDLYEILKQHEDDVINDAIIIIGDDGSGKQLTTAASCQYLCDQQKRVVRIDGNQLDLSRSTDFSRFLINMGFQGFPYIKAKCDNYYEHFYEIQNQLAIVLENVDSIMMKMEDIPFIDPATCVSADKWIQMIVSRKLLPHSTLVASCLPATICSLNGHPKKIYKLSGYDNDKMEKSMSMARNFIEKISSLLQSHNATIQNLVRNPASLSRIAKKYQQNPQFLNSNLSSVDWYDMILPGRNNNQSSGNDITRKIDQFYFKLAKNMKTSFDVADLKKEKLTVLQLMQYSLISGSNDSADSNTRIKYQPRQPSIMAYHAARYIANELSGNEFNDLISTKKFPSSVDDEDLWVLIRKFVGNILSKNTPSENNNKSDKLMEYLCQSVFNLGKTSIYFKYIPNWSNIEKYQRQLTLWICEIMELNNTKTAKKYFSSKSGLNLEVRPSTGSQLKNVSNFINCIDPQLARFMLYLHGDYTCDEFNYFLDSIAKLSNKIQYTTIFNIKTSKLNIEKLANIFLYISARLDLFYDDNEAGEDASAVNKKLQEKFNLQPNTPMHITSQHKYHYQLIKQQKSSSHEDLQLYDSPFVGNNKTVNLMTCEGKEEKLIHQIDGKCKIDLFLGDVKEIKILSNILRLPTTTRFIDHLIFYIPANSTNQIVQLCRCIMQHERKIEQIWFYNLTSSTFHDDLTKLVSKVEYLLDLRWTDEMTDERKTEIVRKFEAVNTGVKVQLCFRDDVRTINKK